MNLNRFLTLEEVAKLLRISAQTAYKMARKGEIPATRVLNQWRFDQQQIEEWVKAGSFEQENKNGKKENNKIKILIADDEQPISETLFEAFEDVEIKTAIHGVDALMEIGVFHPEILVLDIKIPGVNGIEACRRLKESPLTKGIFIIAIIDFPDEKVENELKEAGCDIFMQRPLEPERLVEVIKKKVEQKKLES